jgi:hypothetical protein
LLQISSAVRDLKNVLPMAQVSDNLACIQKVQRRCSLDHSAKTGCRLCSCPGDKILNQTALFIFS